MECRRVAALQLELDDSARFDLRSVFDGGSGLDVVPRWLAHAPALDGPVEVTLAQVAILGTLASDAAVRRAALVEAHGEVDVDALIRSGLLRDVQEPPSPAAARDAAARDVPWWTPALHAQVAGAWSGVDVGARREAGLVPDVAELVETHGQPPGHDYRRRGKDAALELPRPRTDALDELLAMRRTCRNFDPGASLPLETLGRVLHRVWGAHGLQEIAPGAVALRKSSPAGGGLHAIEAYLVALRVDGLEPGIYHYVSTEHALEPLVAAASSTLATLARGFVSGQDWFDGVPAMVIMTARFDRLFWKYRRHAKAWRVLHLDAGHLSQTLYLSAADLGLGAFVTAAINDGDIGSALGLAPLREAAIAIVGFGHPSASRTNVELDASEPTPAMQRFAAD